MATYAQKELGWLEERAAGKEAARELGMEVRVSLDKSDEDDMWKVTHTIIGEEGVVDEFGEHLRAKKADVSGRMSAVSRHVAETITWRTTLPEEVEAFEQLVQKVLARQKGRREG